MLIIDADENVKRNLLTRAAMCVWAPSANGGKQLENLRDFAFLTQAGPWSVDTPEVQTPPPGLDA